MVMVNSELHFWRDEVEAHVLSLTCLESVEEFESGIIGAWLAYAEAREPGERCVPEFAGDYRNDIENSEVLGAPAAWFNSHPERRGKYADELGRVDIDELTALMDGITDTIERFIFDYLDIMGIDTKDEC